MTLFLVVLSLDVVAGAFVAGKVYGARLEAKAIAEYLKASTTVTRASLAVIADIKANTFVKAFDRIRKAL
jgi:hypothetical protein